MTLEDNVDAGVDITKTGDRGVLKRIIKEGEGTETPHVGCDVKVHYTGTLLDGTKFDSSKDRKEPFEFPLGKETVIKAWDIGVATMKKGEVCMLTCAPEYAYGASGSPPKIPPNATLQFEIEMIEWKEEDLTRKKDGGILRHIIEAGTGRSSPSDDVEVTVELEGKLQENGKVFDSRTVTFTLGDGADINICDGIERALEFFVKGEKSRITIQPKYAFKSKGNEALGVPPNAVLEYIITLQDFEPKKDFKYMSDDEKLAKANELKHQGTNYFINNKFSSAIKKYKKIVTLLNDGETDSQGYCFSPESQPRAKELLLSAHLNLSLVYLKAVPQHFFESEEHARQALRIDPTNVKGRFRLGQALLGNGEADRAINEFMAVMGAEPNNKAAVNMLKMCRATIRKQKEKERRLYGNMFDKFAKHDNEAEQRARLREAAEGARVGEWGGAEGAEWTDRQRDRKPTHFERENPNILMLDRDGTFQNM